MLEDEYGLDLTGWALTVASAISPDGRWICGSGTYFNGTRTEGRPWAVYIPAPGAGLILIGAAVFVGRRRRAV